MSRASSTVTAEKDSEGRKFRYINSSSSTPGAPKSNGLKTSTPDISYAAIFADIPSWLWTSSWRTRSLAWTQLMPSNVVLARATASDTRAPSRKSQAAGISKSPAAALFSSLTSLRHARCRRPGRFLAAENLMSRCFRRDVNSHRLVHNLLLPNKRLHHHD